MWDAESGQEMRSFKGHASLLQSVALSPDGQRLVTGSRDFTVKVWDVESGEELLMLKGHVGDRRA
jgi:WD40 repeat protein